MKPLIKKEEELDLTVEGPFPAKILLSSRDTSAASVKVGTLEKGRIIPVHSHAESDQIEYYLSGKAIMFIEGLGEKVIERGTFTYIPKGVKHGVREVIELLKILTVFVPPLF
jgi:quercetin dioxygenase-like cupin family protein